MDEYKFGDIYLINQINKPSDSYVKLTINDRPMTIPTIDNVRLVSEDGFNFKFDPDLNFDKRHLAIDLYKTMLMESKFESHSFSHIDASIELVRNNNISFSVRFTLPYTKLSLGSYLLAGLATYLTPKLLLEPKLKYMSTNKTYLFVNSNNVDYPFYSDDDQYRFALQFKVPIIQYNRSVDFIVASAAKPYVDIKPKDENFVGELEFDYYRYTIGKVYDGNQYFILDYGNWFMPFNGDYEFGGVMPLSLDILKVSELSPDLIDDICTKAAKRR